MKGDVMRTILFAADLSPASRTSFQLACGMASALKSKLLIVHAIETSQDPLDPLSISYLHADLEKFVPENIDLEYEHLIRPGDPATVIGNAAKSCQADLVVLGTHGRKGMERLIVGSVAEKVIRTAPCPVLTLREHTPGRLPAFKKRVRRILVPTDFSAQSYSAISFASSIAVPLHASVTILNVLETDDSPQRTPSQRKAAAGNETAMMLDQLKHVVPAHADFPIEHQVIRGNPSKCIAEFANEGGYDFVIVGTHGRSGIGRALIGSVAEQVVRNCDAPVICVKLTDIRSPTVTTGKTRKSSPSAPRPKGTASSAKLLP
jgi:nucleotide-binding universal stress UspA family protein